MDDEIYDHIIFLADPELSEPVLVIALEGWIDAGLGASNAIGTMLDTIYTEVLATFDTEYFIDQRARRPIARIIDGVTTELTWPEIQLRFGRDGDGADILFLVGPEPGLSLERLRGRRDRRRGPIRRAPRRRARCLPAPTPHTRPVRIIGTAPASSAHLLTRVGTVSGELEVPAGISSALELGFSEVDMESSPSGRACRTTSRHAVPPGVGRPHRWPREHRGADPRRQRAARLGRRGPATRR